MLCASYPVVELPFPRETATPHLYVQNICFYYWWVDPLIPESASKSVLGSKKPRSLVGAPVGQSQVWQYQLSQILALISGLALNTYASRQACCKMSFLIACSNNVS